MYVCEPINGSFKSLQPKGGFCFLLERSKYHFGLGGGGGVGFPIRASIKHREICTYIVLYSVHVLYLKGQKREKVQQSGSSTGLFLFLESNRPRILINSLKQFCK